MYRFRLSNVFPASWFSKLVKNMTTRKNKTTHTTSLSSSSSSSPPQPLPPQDSRRKSCYTTTRDVNNNCHQQVPDEPPRKSSRRKRQRLCRAPKPVSTPPELPPIITDKPSSYDDPVAVRRIQVSSSSPGVKLRPNSPRIRQRGRKSSASRPRRPEGMAVVKSSMDPRRDFRESMVEMILENDLRAAKDLEELLVCYLSLNSDEYHQVIINVFTQIWFDFADH